MSRVVVVTGASQGVGRADGARLRRPRATGSGLIAREGDGLAAAAAEAAARAPGSLAAPAELADPGAVEAAAAADRGAARPDRRLGERRHGLGLLAGRRADEAEVRRVTEVTYLGAVNGTLAALRRMRPRDRGRIVQVGSALAYRAIPLQAAYCGAKFAAARLHRRAALRAAARRQRRDHHLGAPAGAQHAPVRGGPHAPAAPPAARAADLPARGGRPGDPARRRPRRARALGRAGRRSRRSSASASPRRCSTATWRAPGTTPSRPTSRCRPGGPTTSTVPCPATAAPAGASARWPSRSAAAPGRGRPSGAS